MIYLDNSATTQPAESVISRMTDVMEHAWANPSSVHGAGLRASDLMAISRRQILSSLGVRAPSPQDQPRLIFTGSGTEANNLAISGTLFTRRDARFIPRIVISADQHPSVLETVRRHEMLGVEVVRIPTVGGKIELADIANAITASTVLVSVMLVNNETGATYDVKKIFAVAKAKNPNVVTHCDAVQGFRHVPNFTPDAFGCDMTTISAHKIHGPKGIGALYISREAYKSRKLSPMTLGGGQESGMRSGTENLPAIAGFAEACALPFDAAYVDGLRKYLIETLPDEITYKPTPNPAPHIVSLTLPGIKSETALHFLSAKEIYVSSGSACSSHSRHISNALTQYGSSTREADCSLRVSLCPANTKDDIDALTAALREALSTLARTE